jgi:hypothetical protein
MEKIPRDFGKFYLKLRSRVADGGRIVQKGVDWA